MWRYIKEKIKLPGKVLTPVEEGLLIILFILIGFVIMNCCGCRALRTVKSTSQDSLKVAIKVSNKDSNKVAVKQVDSSGTNTFSSHKETTETIGIAGSEVGAIIPEDKADSNVDVKQGNVRLTAYTDKQGNRHIKCAADSLTIVVDRMKRDSINSSTVIYRLRDSVNELKHVASADTTTREKSLKEVVQEAQPTWGAKLLDGLLKVLAVIGAVTVGYYILKIFVRA